MEICFTEKEQAFYDEVDEFLRTELPADWPSRSVIWPGDYAPSGYGTEENYEIAFQFIAKLVDKKWLTISWPEEYSGKQYTHMEQSIFDERMTYYRAPMVDSLGVGIVGPMLLRIGTPEQQAEWIPRIATAEIRCWLAYSEPNAGSDLAAIETTAIKDGDEYVINGQKVWSSGAHISQFGWLIARTDPSAGKHQGVSLFMLDNNLPGITIRPIENIIGESHFNEVFFDNVRIPARNLIGEENKGFYHLMSALDFERVALVGIGGFRRMYEELLEYARTTKLDGKILGKQPDVRHKLVDIGTRVEIAYQYVWQIAAMIDQGLNPTVESSVLKVVSTELARDMSEVGMDILGPYSQLTKPSDRTPLRALVSRGYLNAISATIGAGTSEIQRNIIAQRGLGMPRYKGKGGQKS